MKSLLTALAVFLSTVAAAQPAVQVHEPWVRATVGHQSATGAFMRLTAPANTRLVEVRTPAAGIAEVHEMRLEGDVMRMRAVPALALPAGQPVELKPGGYHVMLMDLKAPVKAGDTVALTLVFEGADGRRQTQQVQAPVRALGAAPAPATAGHGAGHGAHKH